MTYTVSSGTEFQARYLKVGNISAQSLCAYKVVYVSHGQYLYIGTSFHGLTALFMSHISMDHTFVTIVEVETIRTVVTRPIYFLDRYVSCACHQSQGEDTYEIAAVAYEIVLLHLQKMNVNVIALMSLSY